MVVVFCIFRFTAKLLNIQMFACFTFIPTVPSLSFELALSSRAATSVMRLVKTEYGLRIKYTLQLNSFVQTKVNY